MLKAENLEVYLAGFHVLQRVSLKVEEREIVSLVGSNGAGKTTFVNAVSGIVRPTSGQIWFKDEAINNLPPYQRVVRGLVQVPEGRKLFPDMTVFENLEMGGYRVHDNSLFQKTLVTVFSFFPILKERQYQKAKTLSGGEQQMLAIGRSLMCQPMMLMLDEPSLGLAPVFVKIIFEIIAKINTSGVTIFLVEQNVRQALTISSRSYIIENGIILRSGDSKNMLGDAQIRKAYLGM